MGLSTKAAPEGAGRYDNLHGDEDMVFLTHGEERAIERRALELRDERLYDDQVQFDDLLAGIDPADYQPQLQRALRNLDKACAGELIAIQAITTALTQIQCLIKREADRVWMDELRGQAQGEICEVAA